jgi:hypothetical protein
MTGASAAVRAIAARKLNGHEPLSLQELHARAADSRRQAAEAGPGASGSPA